VRSEAMERRAAAIRRERIRRRAETGAGFEQLQEDERGRRTAPVCVLADDRPDDENLDDLKS